MNTRNLINTYLESRSDMSARYWLTPGGKMIEIDDGYHHLESLVFDEFEGLLTKRQQELVELLSDNVYGAPWDNDPDFDSEQTINELLYSLHRDGWISFSDSRSRSNFIVKIEVHSVPNLH